MPLLDALQLTRPAAEHVEALERFFALLAAAGDDRTFHPHPFTREEAEARCAYTGNDLYYVLGTPKRIIAYGMLRGWDEGYEVPSLGLAVDPRERGCGLGRLLIEFLHAAAAWRGAQTVRLKVYRENERARSLYESVGYQFVDGPEGELLGTVRIAR